MAKGSAETKRAAENGASHQAPTAKLFMQGRSQAVRLPKEFRLPGTEVRVSRIGNKVVLEPLSPEPFDVAAWSAKLDQYKDFPFVEDGEPEDLPVQPDPSASFD